MWRERPLASDDATGATAVWPLAIVRKRGCMTVQSAIRRALRSVWERASGATPPKWMEMRAASAQMHAGDECNAFLYLSATRCWMCARWYAESDRCVINQRRDAIVCVCMCVRSRPVRRRVLASRVRVRIDPGMDAPPMCRL